VFVETIDYKANNASEALHRSLHATGFAVLANHPISAGRISDLYDRWGAFFADDEKFSYAIQPNRPDGYFAFRSENAKDSTTKDLKEFFHIYPESIMPDSLRQETNRMYADLRALGVELLNCIQQQTPPSIKQKFTMPLDEMMQDSTQSLLRILHYPPIDNAEDGAMRAAPHEDINLITLLLSGSSPGLQAKDAAGAWHDIPCENSMITINTGDMLAVASDNYYPSTTHRVINPDTAQNISRYSMPMFLHPRPEVALRPGWTANEYRQQRLKEIGLLP
tara:strand:- start:7452 stop:8285 length:834 start_codon:yes stop_codon:yes gene_type:complete